jgi:succinate-semialdehyde dehydrogenase/glutarate-semialdehyde dehydrogenase
MGKPITESLGEVEKSAVTADHYVAHAGRILADEHVDIDGAQAWTGTNRAGAAVGAAAGRAVKRSGEVDALG